jgi:enoyl-CoA hydratase
MMIKECVNRAYESALAEGLLFERRALHAAFSLHDQKKRHECLCGEATRHIHQYLR